MSAYLQPLELAARTGPEQVLLEIDGTQWTAAALRDATSAVAKELSQRGYQAGEVIALHASPCAQFITNLFAIQWLGAVPLPIPADAPPAHIAAIRTAVGPHHWMDPIDHLQYSESFEAAEIQGETEVLAIATSGTTGTPKVIRLTHEQISASAKGSAQRLEFRTGDRWLCSLPLHHIGGLSILFRCIQQCGTAVVLPFDAESVATAMDSGQVNHTSLVPTQLTRVLDTRPDTPFPKTLRCILLGGAPTAPTLLERCRQIQAPVAITWGMSETASQVATRTPGDTRDAVDVGHPLSGVQVEVEDGFLVVVGPIAPNGRYRTADRGHVDPNGRVIVTGRGADLIVSGGENIDPVAVERVLLAQHGVTDVAIISREDPTWGQRPVAICVGAGPSIEDELRQAIADALPRFAIPDAFIWTDALPRTAMGKLDREQLALQESNPL